MAHDIDIVTESLASNLSAFQSEMSKMQTLMGEIRASTAGAKAAWKGSASDQVIGDIEAFQQVFEQVDAQNQKYVTFLNTVINSYTAEDAAEGSSLSANAANYTVNSLK